MGTGRSQLGRDREDVALRAPTCGCSYPSGACTRPVLVAVLVEVSVLVAGLTLGSR